MSTPPLPFGIYQFEVYGRGLGGERPALPTTFDGLQERAREQLSDAAYGYVAGGAGEERTMRANRAAFDRHRLVPRMLGEVGQRDLTTTVCDTTLNAPVVLGPVGVLSIVHPEGELAVARAANELGVASCLSNAASTTLEDVATATPDAPRWFQLYPPNDPEVRRSLVARAEAAGNEAIVVTLDTLTMPWRPRDIAQAYLPFLLGEGIANYTADPVFRSKLAEPPEESPQLAIQQWAQTFPNPQMSWDDLAALRSETGLPLLVKGILHPDDARRAVELGIDGIVVSNHGGRQVDGSVASLDQLPAIVDAVPASVPVLLDSGVRTGSDVLKAIALGARAVLIARPYVWGLALAGQDGVREVVRSLLADLDLSLAMCGCSSLAQVDGDLLVPAPGA
ncbi:L-lactate dehydrogenase [Patulibacter medicamentivorans]|uniref:L-lactate dehydrogenase n=1 Tax=Patulibacter medicamentivorans TaxID=1097667 RepID=H0E4E7_9ACTN|nr:alpha-hydroxy-acid oxidizing protein [Patulibacter medicamentivorans]EHN11445.1 L-lactate dehydrogenase [Patulibacter medicamentivorans]